MELQEKIKEALKLETEKESIRDKIIILKQEMLKELENRFPLLVRGRKDIERAKYDFDQDRFNNETQILLRSMIKGDVILKVPDQNGARRGWNLTPKYGLKIPRCWGNYNFLPYGRWVSKEGNPEMKDLLYIDGSDKIDFSVLKDSKYVNQDKFDKFLEFLVKIIEVWKAWKKIEDSEIKSGKFRELKDLSDYSDIESFKSSIELLPEFEKIYIPYSTEIQIFLEMQNALMEEMKIFNKPFRVLLKLKKE